MVHNLNSQFISVCVRLLVLYVSLKWVAGEQKSSPYPYDNDRTQPARKFYTKKICLNTNQLSRAKSKTCFLRPDTGPCRSDIVQWYFDVKESQCYRFFWGGCQGNGNRFETRDRCLSSCYLPVKGGNGTIPRYCALSFSYGTCFGYYHRWTYDSFAKSCIRRMYSGCGGNQNNFETRDECVRTCMGVPDNTYNSALQYTTCYPIQLPELH